MNIGHLHGTGVMPAVAGEVPSSAGTEVAGGSETFSVRLEEFEGPFDLLLSLIAKHRLDVTVLALHRVVDDFVAHLRARGTEWDLDETTEFLVIAATLLDLKAARLLPSGEVEDEEDIALLEARDLLFARLLQYRAFREVADMFAQRFSTVGRCHPRAVPLEPRFAGLLPDVLLGLGAAQFAAVAARAVAPRPPAPTVSTTHVHTPRVSVPEQAAILTVRLRRHSVATFRRLVADADSTLVVVGRFLALLEMFRAGLVAFEQETPLADLHVRWVGPFDGDVILAGEIHDQDGTSPDNLSTTSGSQPHLDGQAADGYDVAHGSEVSTS